MMIFLGILLIVLGVGFSVWMALENRKMREWEG